MVRRRALALAALALAGTACLPGGREPLPRALRTYLDALRARDYRAAYDQTQLDELTRTFGSGAALSYAHFVAFRRAHPLTRYAVRKVTRLEVRTIDAPSDRGSPYFEVETELTEGGRAHRETFTVEGEVVGTVNVEPDHILVRNRARAVMRGLLVDGIPTLLAPTSADAPGVYALLLLQGSHTLELEGRAVVTISTRPLAVVKGTATIDQGGAPIVVLG